MHPNAMQRHQVLEILYLELQKNPKRGWVNELALKKLGDIEFAVVCLQKLGHVKQDGFNTEITGAGILAYEEACLQAA
jgi:hypothetical protein